MLLSNHQPVAASQLAQQRRLAARPQRVFTVHRQQLALHTSRQPWSVATRVAMQQDQATVDNSRPSASSKATDQLTAVSDTGLPRTAVVGVLGGGQLGRMMALAAANMGVAVKFLDPAENAPAAVAAQQTVGHFRDAAAIGAFAAGCDVLTVEIEHIDADAMEEAARSSGVDVEPTPSTLRTIQVCSGPG
eukprot:GHUV01030232.1.p1 GENE.GHUV01030232.1~~GHUV01030232.1.p1  ORF type:complete len:190 (+),score=64.10 GHUV01030232.1:191-760(+)